MSDQIGEIKVFLMKTFEDVQFKIDIACQTIITKRKSEGLDFTAVENRYIHEYILVESKSNKFYSC